MNQFLGTNQPVMTNEGLARRFNSLLTVWSQRKVGATRVTAIEGPFSFAVTDDKAARGHRWY